MATDTAGAAPGRLDADERRGDPLSRRDALRLAGTAALASTVAACTSSSRPTKTSATSASASSTSDTSTSATSSTPSATTSATPTASSTTRPAHSTSPDSAPTTAQNSKPTYDQLASKMSGALARPGKKGYDAGALLYNPRFARQPQPQAIAACRTADDVAACVRFAADGGAPLRIRNGGHSYGGWSSGPGLVADLAAMNQVSVDTGAGTARVGAGALLIDVYAALAKRRVAIGAGSCPTVGVTGLTLGGGVGVLSRAYGLTCDQVTAFDVVTADGKKRTVDRSHDPELFWALRGGGGSFAAVTALTFRVRPAPTIDRFYLQWSWAHAGEVVQAWQQWVRTAPRELWSTCKLLGDPGSGLKATVAGTWIGSSSLNSVLTPLLKGLPGPVQNVRQSAGYGATMAAEAGCADLDPASCITKALSPAVRSPFAATSSILATQLPAAGVQAAVQAVGNSLGIASGKLIEAGMSFDALGGAVADVAAGGTAFPWRTAFAVVQHTATWKSSAANTDPAPFDGFVRGARKALAPWAGTSAYVNYADAAITDYAAAYWGANLARLRAIRHTYDAANVFGFPQAVPL